MRHGDRVSQMKTMAYNHRLVYCDRYISISWESHNEYSASCWYALSSGLSIKTFRWSSQSRLDRTRRHRKASVFLGHLGPRDYSDMVSTTVANHEHPVHRTTTGHLTLHQTDRGDNETNASVICSYRWSNSVASASDSNAAAF